MDEGVETEALETRVGSASEVVGEASTKERWWYHYLMFYRGICDEILTRYRVPVEGEQAAISC